MRRSTSLIILAALAAMFLSACAGTVRNNATVKIGMDQDGLAYSDSIYGQMPFGDWIETSSRQGQNTVAVALWDKAKKAVDAGNLKEAKECINLAQEVSVNNSYTKAKLINASDYRITILDGPFASIVLAPGDSTIEQKVPIGTLAFTVLWGNKQDKRAAIVRQVTAGQKSIVIINK